MKPEVLPPEFAHRHIHSKFGPFQGVMEFLNPVSRTFVGGMQTGYLEPLSVVLMENKWKR